MKKGTIRIFGWCVAALIGLAGLGLFGLKLFVSQGFSDPFLYTLHSPSQRHQALFLQEGFQDRSWTLFVKAEGLDRPLRVASLDFDGAYRFNGAEWSKDGEVIVAKVLLMGGNYDHVRAFGYDFATRKALVPEWNRWREHETNVLAVVAAHGGFGGNFVSDQNMTTGAQKIWVWQIPK
jgi:hypothetical protein